MNREESISIAEDIITRHNEEIRDLCIDGHCNMIMTKDDMNGWMGTLDNTEEDEK